MPLTDTAVRNAKRREKPQKLSDGGGLHLLVNPHGARSWRLAYRYQGRQKTLALGVYPIVSLADARMARDAAKKLLARDIDPSQARKEQKRAARLSADNTFEIVAREWCENQRDGWTALYHDHVMTRLEADVFPEIGSRPITEIEPPELLAVLRKVEKSDSFASCFDDGQGFLGSAMGGNMGLALVAHMKGFGSLLRCSMRADARVQCALCVGARFAAAFPSCCK